MTKESYEKIFRQIAAIPNGVQGILVIGKLMTVVTALVYFAELFAQLFGKQWRGLAVLILVPGISFVLVSLFRNLYDAKRPYEVYGFTPLIPKETKGKSFPSRHVFSIFVIGSSLCWYQPYAGVLVCLMGCLLAACRVVSGVHFPKDVIGGAIIGILCGCLTGVLL
ncbi:MAG: phosphatase PAP2 family protein [Butyribacter sp.]|nr:phosphatase PAP2 family protein [bacterium]MDY3853674.1 phosphatase PAP2 family protein [Butyribacter sp.]